MVTATYMSPSKTETKTDDLDRTVDRACLYIEQHIDEDVPLATVGREVGLSSSHLQRVFKQKLGVSPREYREAIRIGRLKGLLQDGDDVSRAILDSGYGSMSTGYEASDRHLGMTPATYGAGGKGAEIRYAITSCSLGRMLVARTDRGLAAVTLADRDSVLIAALEDEFPNADISLDQAGLADLCAQVVEVAEGRQKDVDIPLEVRATDFQWKVWRALRSIPEGETRTYSELAALAGNPAAHRAAANACGRNRIAVVIPCHRVVRSDGSPGGYRWGVEKKLALLERETAA